MKRFLSMLVALVMILAVVPVLAAEGDVQAVYDYLTVESITQNELEDFVTKDLILPTSLPEVSEGVTIAWASSDTTAVTNDGKVTRTDIEDKPVTLTATITNGVETLTKEFAINVVPNATAVFYQNNFHYPELVGTSTVVTSAIGWSDTGSGGTTVEKSIRKDADGNHYLYMDHASTKGYPEIGPTFSAKGSKITIRMDISVDATNGTQKIIDLWLGMARGNTVDYSKPRMNTNANNITNLAGKLNLDAPPQRTELYIELDMTNFTMRAKKGANGTWTSSWSMPSANEDWTGELKKILFRRGSGGSPAAELQVDNMIVYEERDRESYIDSLFVDEVMNVLDVTKMTDEKTDEISKDFTLLYPELQESLAENGATISFESSNPDVIEISGDKAIVKRDYVKQDVTITATVTRNLATSTKSFRFTVIENESVYEIQNALAFRYMTNQSNYAITENLDLNNSALRSAIEKTGATVTFESSDPSVLQVSGGKGIITRQDEEKEATLTAKVAVGSAELIKEYTIVVPSITTHVFTSEDFNYADKEGQLVNTVSGWTTPTNPGHFTSTIEEEDGEYFIQGVLPESANNTYRTAYTFKNDRDVTNVSVEFTAHYREDSGVNAIYEFELYGGTTDKDIDETKTIARIQTTGNAILLYGHPEGSTGLYGKSVLTATRAARGKSDRFRFDFDFENQGFYFYLNGVKKTDLIPFAEGMTYDSFKKFNFAAFRQALGSKILIDDFVIQSRDVEFTQDYVTEAGQPLTLEVSFNDTKYSDSVYMYVTSDYDEENDLRQLFKVNNAGDELTKNVIFDYLGAELVNKDNGTKTQLVKTPTADESPALHYSHTYLACNHGVSFGVRVKRENHGKTYGDIGSVWLDEEGTQWTLVRVNSESELLFLSETEKDASNHWNFKSNIAGTKLTYDASADNNFALDESDIIIDSIAEINVQIPPSIGNRDQRLFVYRDGEVSEYVEVDTIREGFSVNCNKVILQETYDVLDPSKIGYNLRLNRPEGGYTAPADISIGTPIMKYKQTITICEDGDVFVEADHEMLETIRGVTYNLYQYYEKADIFGGGVYRYVPGVKDLVHEGVTYEFSKPFNMADYFPGYEMTKKYWADENFAPDRAIEYYRDEDGKNKMAFVSGFVPIGDAAPDKRRDNTSVAFIMYNRTGLKMYPMFVDNAKFGQAGAKMQGTAFRHYDTLDQSTDKVTAYDVEYKDDVYYYVDFLEDEDNFTLNLSEKTVLSNVELVYKSADVEYSIDGNTLTASGKQSGFICVKGKRSAEIGTVSYDDFTDELAVWINNRELQAVTGDILIAGYADGKFKSSLIKKDISIAADDFTRVDLTEFNGDGVEEIRIFLWKDGEIKPLNLTKYVNLK